MATGRAWSELWTELRMKYEARLWRVSIATTTIAGTGGGFWLGLLDAKLGVRLEAQVFGMVGPATCGASSIAQMVALPMMDVL